MLGQRKWLGGGLYECVAWSRLPGGPLMFGWAMVCGGRLLWLSAG